MTALVSEIGRRLGYLGASLALIASQNLVVWWARQAYKVTEPLDLEFWLTPLSSALDIYTLPPFLGAGFFAYFLLVAWLVALLSFKLARRTNRGFLLAVASVVPVIQLAAIFYNAILPAYNKYEDSYEDNGRTAQRVTLGLIAGIALIVVAVIISAVTFGAYGWGLFVMTPLLVGTTTGYLVNSDQDIGLGKTIRLALASAALGSLALIILALEGFVCIILVAPLAAPFVMLGASLGRAIAKARHSRGTPLLSIAVLPMIFMLEGTIPPEAPIFTQYDIEISAPAERVWKALISSEAIEVAPGLTAVAGLAYPISGKLEGEGLGAKRTGLFSTGKATETVTQWEANKRLAFSVQHQPAAMEEMSPYRRVHAPHVEGYFVTGETRFDLVALTPNQTRLRISSEHRLRIDPIPYWEPIARLAIRANVNRVLEDIKTKSERNSTTE